MASFNTLWSNHPSNQTPPEHYPCKDKKGNVHSALENQCAIRLGIAMQESGISLKSLMGSRCWNGHGRKHVLKVLQMVPWIEAHASSIGVKKKTVHKNVTDADFRGKRGIVYWQNFYGNNNQGDHIDLWDGDRIAKGSNDYFERSEQVWFWEALS
jgi:hypothetical protein